MKKIVASLLILTGAVAGLFAANDASTTSLSVGISFPQIYNLTPADSSIDSEKYTAFGINFAGRTRLGLLPFGGYIDGNFYWPYAHKIEIDGVEYSYDMSDGSWWGIEGQVGVYSVLINLGRFLVPFGGGLHLGYAKSSATSEPNMYQSSFSLGIGGWANAELTITEKVTIYGGVRIDYDFWQRLYTKTRTTQYVSGSQATVTASSSEKGHTSTLSVIPAFGVVFRF